VFDQELPHVLGGYALFHGLVGTACLGWAVLRLRTLGLRDGGQSARRERPLFGGIHPIAVVLMILTPILWPLLVILLLVGLSRSAKAAPVPVDREDRPRRRRRVVHHSRKPVVGRYPMIWKEVFAEGGLRLNALGRIFAGVLVAASFLPTVGIIWYYVDNGFAWGPGSAWEKATQGINMLQMRVTGTIVAVLMLLAVVVRAAGSVRSEHERHTFDELLTTRLTNSEILFGKWLGSVLSVRWAWLWLGLIWFICAVLGGVQIVMLPVILLAWVVYAAVGSGVGLWFSIGSKTTLRATVAALMTMLFLYGGHWLLTAMCCFIPLAALRVGRGGGENIVEFLMKFQAGQTPPFVMALLAFHGMEFEHKHDWKDMIELTVSSLFGLGCWAALIPLLWVAIKRRFEMVTGRSAALRPERIAPRRKRSAPQKARVVDDEPTDNGDILDVLPAEEQEKPPAV
jgi:ABC-type transport system involved in multi-copper enzyme maturation permease subunit